MTLDITCERDALSSALGAAARATATRGGALPVLAGIQIVADADGTITFTGTDLDMTVIAVAEGKVGTAGTAVVPARLTGDIVRQLDPGAVHLVADGKNVQITAGRSAFEVQSFPADDFPKVSSIEGTGIVLQAAQLANALSGVVPAASHDDARPILTGVLFGPRDGGGLRLVATDSYRLAIHDIPGAAAPENQCLVPARALAEVNKLLSGAEEVSVILGERDIEWRVGTTIVKSRLIEGEFPNYRQLIPSSSGATITGGSAEFLDAIKRVKLLARESTPIRIAPSKDVPNEILLSAITQDVGNAKDEIKVDSVEGAAPDVIAFNPDYLADGINACGSESIRIDIVDALKPVLVRPASGDDESDFTYLLMPVRIS